MDAQELLFLSWIDEVKEMKHTQGAKIVTLKSGVKALLISRISTAATVLFVRNSTYIKDTEIDVVYRRDVVSVDFDSSLDGIAIPIFEFDSALVDRLRVTDHRIDLTDALKLRMATMAEIAESVAQPKRLQPPQTGLPPAVMAAAATKTPSKKKAKKGPEVKPPAKVTPKPIYYATNSEVPIFDETSSAPIPFFPSPAPELSMDSVLALQDSYNDLDLLVLPAGLTAQYILTPELYLRAFNERGNIEVKDNDPFDSTATAYGIRTCLRRLLKTFKGEEEWIEIGVYGIIALGDETTPIEFHTICFSTGDTILDPRRMNRILDVPGLPPIDRFTNGQSAFTGRTLEEAVLEDSDETRVLMNATRVRQLENPWDDLLVF